MKLSKSIAGIALATSLVLGPSIAAIAETPAPTPVPTPVPTLSVEPISKKVGKKERKAILDARKSAAELAKKADRMARSVANKEAIAAWQEAVKAWETANADALAALKVIRDAYKATCQAADAAYEVSAKTKDDVLVKKQAKAAALAAYKDAVTALGPLPAKPAKPELSKPKPKKKG